MRPVSGGTDTHLALIDLRDARASPARRPRPAATRRGITLNKNAIPYDPQPPMVASGIRVGTPAVTTQGMTEGDDEGGRRADRPGRPRRRRVGGGRDRARRSAALVGAVTRRTRVTASGRRRRVREYLLTLVRRGRGHLPADARSRGASPCAGAR